MGQDNTLKYKVGMIVKLVADYGLGPGEIIEVGNNTIVVQFKNGHKLLFDRQQNKFRKIGKIKLYLENLAKNEQHYLTITFISTLLGISPLHIIIMCYLNGYNIGLNTHLDEEMALQIENWFDPDNNEATSANSANFQKKLTCSLSKVGKIKNLMREFKFKEAESLFRIDNFIPKTYYVELKEKYEHEYIDGVVVPLLEQYEFLASDKLVEEKHFNRHDSYCIIKTKYIHDYFKERFAFGIDEQKSEILAVTMPNMLVTARAGSGKTRLLTCKAAFLINEYGVDPDKILLLAFNKKAAREMQERIVKDFKIKNFQNSRTFHSLAYKIVKPEPEQEILYDQSDGFAGSLSIFVRNVLRDIWNPAFQETMLKLFKKEMVDVERRGDLLEKDDYYIFRRNMRDITLKGDRVKSNGEKFIADFLFEHDIKYAYEKGIFWGDETYRPDFTIHINQEDIVIEHWALDPGNYAATLPEHWTKTANEYRAEIQRKKCFLEKKGIRLIETSVADLNKNGIRDTRKYFEGILKAKLKSCDIIRERLPDKEIADRVLKSKSQVSRMVRMFVQFIQKILFS